MFDKIAVIGEADLVFALRALGIKVYTPQDTEEARQVLASLEKDKVAFCFIHEKLFEALSREREALKKKLCPVVVGFSDYREITGRWGEMLKEMAVKATGSDSLVRRRGKDETR